MSWHRSDLMIRDDRRLDGTGYSVRGAIHQNHVMPIHQPAYEPRWENTPPEAALPASGPAEEGERVMAYGHAERNLAVIRRLEAETEELLRSLEQLVPDQRAWPEDSLRPTSQEDRTQS
jgi:hypothetical protein